MLKRELNRLRLHLDVVKIVKDKKEKMFFFFFFGWGK